jgi:hypothetical protein
MRAEITINSSADVISILAEIWRRSTRDGSGFLSEKGFHKGKSFLDGIIGHLF